MFLEIPRNSHIPGRNKVKKITKGKFIVGGEIKFKILIFKVSFCKMLDLEILYNETPLGTVQTRLKESSPKKPPQTHHKMRRERQ